MSRPENLPSNNKGVVEDGKEGAKTEGGDQESGEQRVQCGDVE